MELTYIVIDDVPSDIERLKREASKTKELRFIRSYSSVYEAIADLRGEKSLLHFIFCDIMLHDENGLDAGPELAKYCKFLVFVTGLPGQKSKVLDAHGDDHLQKPVTCDQIRTRVLDRFFKRHGDELPLYIHLNKLYIYDSLTKKYHPERLKDIQYFAHSKNYLDIAVSQGKTYTIRATLSNAYTLVEPAGIFVRINKSTLVNMDCVVRLDGTEVWIGETRFSLLGEGKKAFMDYVKRHGLGNGGTHGQSEK